MKRQGKCRGCHGTLLVDQEVLHTYTTTGRGHDIYFCEKCVNDIAVHAMDKFESAVAFDEYLVMNKLKENL